jgi:hypothetical protein
VQNVLVDWPDWVSIDLNVGVELLERMVHELGGFYVAVGDGQNRRVRDQWVDCGCLLV